MTRAEAIALLVGLLAVLGLVAFVYVATKREQEDCARKRCTPPMQPHMFVSEYQSSCVCVEVPR